jgi:hypothetical protein
MLTDLHPSRGVAMKALLVFALVVAPLLMPALFGATATAQNTARPTPTPHLITAPSRPVRNLIVDSTPIPPGAKVPTPGMVPPPEHPVLIGIDTDVFTVRPGPCAFRVRAAIDADKDLFTGDKDCDSLIRQARAIQRQKEAEDPEYVRRLHATPVPTPAESGDDETR